MAADASPPSTNDVSSPALHSADGGRGHGSLRVAVVGAGPVGLDAALAARERGHRVTAYEAAPHPAGHVRSWGHVRLFTPWSMNVSPRMQAALGELGRAPEIDEGSSPSGHELADRVLDPLWTLPGLAGGLRLGTRVVAVGRAGTLKHEEIGSSVRRARPFRLLLADGKGREWVEHHDVVLDCSGKYGNPNPLGDGGIPAPGESGVGPRIAHRIPDLSTEDAEWRGRSVLLVGAGHSAQTAARDLAAMAEGHPGTRVFWSVRGEAPDWGEVPDDPLPLRRRLTREARDLAEDGSGPLTFLPGTVVDGLSAEGGRVRVRLRERREGGGPPAGDPTEVEVDRILALTGGVGDHTLYRQLQVHECYATSGPMKLAAALLGAGGGDCLTQTSHGADTLMNPEPDFFILGDKSYGRNNTFLLTVGWSQVDEVFGVLDGEL